MSLWKICVLLCLAITTLTASVSSYNNYSLILNNETTEIDYNMVTYLLDIIYKHFDYALIFHFDIYNMNYVAHILDNMDRAMMRTINLILYNDEDKLEMLFERPKVSNIFNIVLLNDLERFSLFLNQSPSSINSNDEAIFVLSQKIGITFLTSNKNINIFGKILVISAHFFGKVIVSTMCYYCGKDNEKLRELVWDINEVVKSSESNTKDFSNLNLHNFNVGFINYFPSIWCKKSNNHLNYNGAAMICNYAKGNEYEVLKIVAKQLNFTYTLFLYKDMISLLDDLSRKQIDFVIGGIVPTAKRMTQGTISRHNWFESFSFLYVLSTSLSEELGRIYYPFNGWLWLLMILLVFVTSSLLYAIDRFGKLPYMESISCSDSLSMCFLMVIEQSVKLKQVFKIRLGPAILIISWILFCLNVSVAYKSKLASIVMNPSNKKPGNIQDLLKHNYKFVINKQYKEIFDILLLNSTDHVAQQASKKTHIADDICNTLIFALENRAAILDEHTTLQFRLRKECKHVLQTKQSDIEDERGSKIRITKSAFKTISHVWLLEQRAPYTVEFDKVLSLIDQAGLTERLFLEQTKHMVDGTFPSTQTKFKPKYKPVSVRILLSLFFLYVVGNFVAVVVFLLELWANRRKPSKMFSHISASKCVPYKD